MLCCTPHQHIQSLNDAERILIFSDYSGQSRDSKYHSYSFLLADIDKSTNALRQLASTRQKYNLHKRHFSYKSLNDKKRAAAQSAFASALRDVHGQVITYAISKSLPHLFRPSDAPGPDTTLSEFAARYKRKTQTHLARILHFLSISIAGMSSPGQHIFWFTDVDDIAPEQDWLHGLCELAGNMSSHYLQHELGHFRVGTTRSDDGTLLLEDLCAVPDLFAGSIAEILSNQSTTGQPFNPFVRASPDAKPKAVNTIKLLWNKPDQNLRSCCVCIDPVHPEIAIMPKDFSSV